MATHAAALNWFAIILLALATWHNWYWIWGLLFAWWAVWSLKTGQTMLLFSITKKISQRCSLL